MIMTSCSNLKRPEYRSIIKAPPVPPLPTSHKLAEPFNRLKNRANLFRRKNYSSQLNISTHSNEYRPTDPGLHPHRPSVSSRRTTKPPGAFVVLKRSNSMICPQEHFQTFLNHNQHRNSICVELAGCSTGESSTDDYQLTQSSLSAYWHKQLDSTMSNIDEHECQLPSESPPLLTLTDSNNNDHGEHRSKANETLLPNDNHNNSEQPSAIIILPARASPSTMDIIPRENEDAAAAAGKQQQQTPSPLPAEPIASSTNPTSIISPSHLSSSSSISSTVILRDHAETIRTRRQCHSSISLLQHQQRHEQSLSTAFEEPFNDYKQAILARKVELNSNMTQAKVSACTMTGRSLNNLDECASSSSSSSSSEDKGVQTILDEPAAMNACIKRAISSTSLSSSSAASIPIDTHEKKSLLPTTSPDEPVTAAANDHSPVQHATEPQYKWPHLHERLLGEHTCVYWVNYLGSTAIKMSDDGATAMPAQAIARLKQSTQYARVLPVIGLSISSRGVEFLKHTKDRVVICFHDIKTIHCACQDQDLRYFAYVTREQRLIHGLSPASVPSIDHKHPLAPSPAPSIANDYHHYCHVFVVKSDPMSTEIMLTFGQVFDIAYRLHRHSKTNGKKPPKDAHALLANGHAPKIEVIRLSTKSDMPPTNHSIMSSSTHSPASSSSSSTDERKIFV